MSIIKFAQPSDDDQAIEILALAEKQGASEVSNPQLVLRPEGLIVPITKVKVLASTMIDGNVRLAFKTIIGNRTKKSKVQGYFYQTKTVKDIHPSRCSAELQEYAANFDEAVFTNKGMTSFNFAGTSQVWAGLQVLTGSMQIEIVGAVDIKVGEITRTMIVSRPQFSSDVTFGTYDSQEITASSYEVSVLGPIAATPSTPAEVAPVRVAAPAAVNSVQDLADDWF